MKTNTSKPIQIFKPGKHTAVNGETLEFSEADLKATVAAYDPAKHEAPLVVGHPRLDGPAYGWVSKLAFADDGIDADPIQVDPQFAEWVKSGNLKKISAAFYAPDSPSNPVPGVYYLRHVGFLGAQPPAIKGLRAPEFADGEQGIVEFSEWDDVTVASVLRNLREWLIGKFGTEEADKVVPQYQVQQLEQSAQDELRESMQETSVGAPAPAFSETKPQGDVMSEEDKKRLAQLEAENKALKDKELAFAEAEKKRKADVVNAESVAFAETQIKAGKLLPKHKEMVVATLNHLAGLEQALEFSEGDVKKPLLASFKEYLAAQPKQVEFSEVGNDKDAAQTSAAASTLGNLPKGATVDQGRLELHAKALAYAEQHKVDYLVAVKAVGVA